MTQQEKVEQYAQILLMAASLLDTLNKRKPSPEVEAIANELRAIADELVNKETDEFKKSKNLLVRLYNFVTKFFN